MLIRIIFEYARSYNLSKQKELIDELIRNPYRKELVQSKKLTKLTNKELEYLLELANNALTVMSMEINSEAISEINSEINAVYYFEERLVEELGLRESSKGKYNDLNIKKKKTKKKKRK